MYQQAICDCSNDNIKAQGAIETVKQLDTVHNKMITSIRNAVKCSSIHVGARFGHVLTLAGEMNDEMNVNSNEINT